MPRKQRPLARSEKQRDPSVTRLKIDRDHIIQMVKAPDFYIAVPEFLYLKEAAMTSWQMYQDQADCRKCASDWKYMRGVCDAMFMKLRDLKQENPDAIRRIKQWLSKRKGYPVGNVVLYYRRSKTQGQIAKFEF